MTVRAEQEVGRVGGAARRATQLSPSRARQEHAEEMQDGDIQGRARNYRPLATMSSTIFSCCVSFGMTIDGGSGVSRGGRSDAVKAREFWMRTALREGEEEERQQLEEEEWSGRGADALHDDESGHGLDDGHRTASDRRESETDDETGERERGTHRGTTQGSWRPRVARTPASPEYLAVVCSCEIVAGDLKAILRAGRQRQLSDVSQSSSSASRRRARRRT